MKKVLVSLLIMSLLMTTALTAFAVPTIDYAFEDENDGKIYLFGKRESTTDRAYTNDQKGTDYGIEITDVNNEEIVLSMKDLDTNNTILPVALEANRFGFSIDDQAGKLGDTFIVRPSVTLPEYFASDKDILAYGEYYKVSPVAGTVAKASTLTEASASADVVTLAESYEAVSSTTLNTGSGNPTYLATRYTIDTNDTAILRFALDSKYEGASKIVLSVGATVYSKSSTAYVPALMDTDYSIDVYDITKVTDKWTNGYTYANTNTWADLSSIDVKDMATAIKSSPKVAVITAADVEKVNYSTNTAADNSNWTNIANGVRVSVDVTKYVEEAMKNGATYIDFALLSSVNPNGNGNADKTSSEVSIVIRANNYESTGSSANNWSKLAASKVSPRLDVIK